MYFQWQTIEEVGANIERWHAGRETPTVIMAPRMKARLSNNHSLDMRLSSHYGIVVCNLESAMLLTTTQMDRKIDEHFGFEASDDVEGVLATLTPDAEHDIVGYPTGPTHGREAARGFYEDLFTALSDSNVEPIRRLYGKNFLVDESLWRGRAPGRPFGLEGKGRPLEFRLLHIVEFAESGHIKRENVWVDLAAIIRQLPQD